MGIVCALSMLQLIMTETLRGLDKLVYIDDILIIQHGGQSTTDHPIKVEQVLNCLETVGFKDSLCKSFIMQKEVRYAGYQLTSNLMHLWNNSPLC